MIELHVLKQRWYQQLDAETCRAKDADHARWRDSSTSTSQSQSSIKQHVNIE
jgi:hypothetical protein